MLGSAPFGPRFIRQLHPNNMLAQVPGYNFRNSTLGWPLFMESN